MFAVGMICVGGWVDALEGPIIIILRDRKCLHVGVLICLNDFYEALVPFSQKLGRISQYPFSLCLG